MTEPLGMTELISRVRSARDSLLAREAPSALWRSATLADIRRIVLIDSAPRSGSSLLYDILRRLPGVYAPRGELVPFFKLYNLAAFAAPGFPSYDALPCADAPEGLARDILRDCSLSGEVAAWGEDLVQEVLLRFPLQWPRLAIPPAELESHAWSVVESLSAPGARSDAQMRETFALELVSRLRKAHRKVNPYYYDIPASTVHARFPRLAVPQGPPDDTLLLEEPPFILAEPAHRPSQRDLAEKLLLIKSVGICYMLPQFLQLFPRAEVRVIHLVRNPAASINGLCDGWLHRGFFSTNVEPYLQRTGGALAIEGYSDRHPWGRRWWNFELPPDWERVIAAPLEQVCAHQWEQANKAILAYLPQRGLAYTRVRFEDFLASPRAELERLTDFLGLPPTPLPERLPVVQATEPPLPFRWRAKRKALLPVLGNPEIQRMARKLGYNPAHLDEWR